MKVFVPLGAAAARRCASLDGAELVPFRLDYPVLRLRDGGDADPRPGEVRRFRPEDWPTAASAR